MSFFFFFFFWLVIIHSKYKNNSFNREHWKVKFDCIVLPDEDRWLAEPFPIYNIHNGTAESEHKIHLQKALLTLGKNSVSILFTLSQAVQPFNTLSYISYIHVMSVDSHSSLSSSSSSSSLFSWQSKKTNGDTDATIGYRARMKHAQPHTWCI